MVIKLLDIFRVFYNFVEVGRNKQTPAVRLGLAKDKITVEVSSRKTIFYSSGDRGRPGVKMFRKNY